MTFDADTLNTALSMSLQWGPVRQQPIEDRLAERFPDLGPREIIALKLTCGEVERLAFGEYEHAYLKQTTAEKADAAIRNQFPWIDSDNMSHLATQGQYYAWHDNG